MDALANAGHSGVAAPSQAQEVLRVDGAGSTITERRVSTTHVGGAATLVLASWRREEAGHADKGHELRRDGARRRRIDHPAARASPTTGGWRLPVRPDAAPAPDVTTRRRSPAPTAAKPDDERGTQRPSPSEPLATARRVSHRSRVGRAPPGANQFHRLVSARPPGTGLARVIVIEPERRPPPRYRRFDW